jgi:hypothetical protein
VAEKRAIFYVWSIDSTKTDIYSSIRPFDSVLNRKTNRCANGSLSCLHHDAMIAEAFTLAGDGLLESKAAVGGDDGGPQTDRGNSKTTIC